MLNRVLHRLTLHQPRRGLSTFARTFIFIAAAKIFIDDNVITFAAVTGESMMPTLSPDFRTQGKKDSVLFTVWSAKRNLNRADVIQFTSPNDPEVFAVKRVIALPGDTVILDPRRRPKVKEGPEPTCAGAWDSWNGRAKVPPGHVWVEGDNWRETSDSNWYGPMSKSLITGKALAVVWPAHRFWGKPWEGWEGRTRVVEGKVHEGHWSEGEHGLMGQLGEVGEVPLDKG